MILTKQDPTKPVLKRLTENKYVCHRYGCLKCSSRKQILINKYLF